MNWILLYIFAALVLNPVSLGLITAYFFPKKFYSFGSNTSSRFVCASISVIVIGFVLNLVFITAVIRLVPGMPGDGGRSLRGAIYFPIYYSIGTGIFLAFWGAIHKFARLNLSFKAFSFFFATALLAFIFYAYSYHYRGTQGPIEFTDWKTFRFTGGTNFLLMAVAVTPFIVTQLKILKRFNLWKFS